MNTESVHRAIERHAAVNGDLVAIHDRDRACSYRELNHAANALARHLIASGFRRGRHALVRMPQGIELATTLLAILKAGGCYTWRHPDRGPSEPDGVSIAVESTESEKRYLHLDLAAVPVDADRCRPNLPIVTRASDIACVLGDGEGAQTILVPHATIIALRSQVAPPAQARWTGEAGAFDLWVTLIAGATAIVHRPAADIAA